jgi:hypothetical protein
MCIIISKGGLAMRRALVSIGLLLLFCSPALAAPSPDLESFLQSLNSICSSPIQTAARKDDPGGITAQSYCEADCGPYGSVSCSGDTCSAVDRNCAAGQRGYVQCDGATTYCPTCGCPEGWVEWRDGGCCSGGRQRYLEYECISGVWEHTGTSCSGSCF